MAFQRDHGHCCLFLPLKFGVGIISMLLWLKSVFDIMSLMEFSQRNAIRLMAGGYNLSVMKLNSIYGSFGIVIGFLGLLGIYDDKPSWINIFCWFVYGRVLLSIGVFGADVYELTHTCQDFHDQQSGWALHIENAPLHALGTIDACHEALQCYVVGFAIEFMINVYLAWNVHKYAMQLSYEPPYAIDFGVEKGSKEGRWDFYRVNEVPYYANQRVPGEEVPLVPTAERADTEMGMAVDPDSGPQMYGALDTALVDEGSTGHVKMRQAFQEPKKTKGGLCC